MVSLLLADRRIDVNSQDEGCTPFFMSCQNGRKEVVVLPLADPRIDVNQPDIDGVTPLLIACELGHKEVVSLLLNDTRIDVNKPGMEQCSPLWEASQNGQLFFVQLMLASGRDIDTKTKSIAGPAYWKNKSAAEIGRCQATRAKLSSESEGDHARKKQNGPLIAALLDSFDLDSPWSCR